MTYRMLFNRVFYGCLLYADDIILISPSVFGLHDLLYIFLTLALCCRSTSTVIKCKKTISF
jgi:hypothetical protein